MSNLVFTTIGVLNGGALCLYGFDKFVALMGWRRVSERVLLLSALPFSAPGALLGVYLFRHKTRKAWFQLWLTGFLVAQLGVLWFFLETTGAVLP